MTDGVGMWDSGHRLSTACFHAYLVPNDKLHGKCQTRRGPCECDCHEEARIEEDEDMSHLSEAHAGGAD